MQVRKVVHLVSTEIAHYHCRGVFTGPYLTLFQQAAQVMDTLCSYWYSADREATAQDAYNALNTSSDWSPDIGALVWFTPNNGNGNAGHVGIYLGNGQFISATYNGVQTNDMTSWSTNVAPYEGWGNAPSNWPDR